MGAVCIIPARGGSVRVPKKNIKLFHGKPIIAYSIENALRSGVFQDIFVSTDDDEIDDIVSKIGATPRDCGVHVHRRPHCDGSMGTQEVTARVLEDLKTKECFACCLYATAPLMHVLDLKLGFVELRDTYSLSVGTNPLCDAGQFYWGTTQAFMERWPLIGTDTVMIPIDERRVCDINTMDDWARAEKMYEALHA